MTIPTGYGHAIITFSGNAVPNGAAITFGFKNDAGSSVIDAAEDIVQIWDGNNFGTILALNCDTQNMRVKLGPDATGPVADRPWVQAGEYTGISGSAAVSGLVKKVTASGGRKNRGRMYVPALSESAVDDGGDINSSWLTVAQAFFDETLEEMGVAQYPMVGLHGDNTTPTLVGALQVDARAATQRRRQRR